MLALATLLFRDSWPTSIVPLLRIDDLERSLRDIGINDIEYCDAKRGIDFAATRRIAAVAEARGADLLVATSQHSLLMGSLARRHMRRRVPIVFISHSMGIILRSLRERLKFRVYRYFYNRADRIIFVSRLQAEFFRRLGVRPRSSTVVHNGVDTARFRHDPARRAQQRHALGFTENDIVFGLCAGLRAEKRQNDLVDAIARLRAAGLPAKCLLIGEGIERPAIEARIAAHGLVGQIVLAGLQEDVVPWVDACDVMTLVSSAETFPISTLEGMALSKPLVASDVGGLSEQVQEGENGFLFPAGDIEALTACLERLCDAGLRQRMGETARQRVASSFSESTMLDAFEHEFRTLALPARAAQ